MTNHVWGIHANCSLYTGIIYHEIISSTTSITKGIDTATLATNEMKEFPGSTDLTNPLSGRSKERPQKIANNYFVMIPYILIKTKRFIIYEHSFSNSPDDRTSELSHHVIPLDCIEINGEYSIKNLLFIDNMNKYGCCIWNDLIDHTLLSDSKKSFKRLQNILKASYDSQEDLFHGLDTETLGITRFPCIGNGKHNIHFDSIDSEYHKILANLAESSHFSSLLSAYQQKTCVLRETGMSVTRPKIPITSSYNTNNDIQSTILDDYDDSHTSTTSDCTTSSSTNNTENTSSSSVPVRYCNGDGMEWHSDGAAGECTVLMALEDIPADRGSLGIVPGSCEEYLDGIGHEEINPTALEKRCSWLSYSQGSPLFFDARTLHAVSPNTSDSWRFVIWFIYDSY
eukprot:gene3786-7520_t